MDKRHYDHAVGVIEQFDSARMRLIEILNDQGYRDDDPQAQPEVWERMNLPIARGLRGLIYVLWDLSQVDPSDLSVLFAGNGRLRIGFGEIDPPARGEPSDELLEDAVRRCCDNPYYAFRKPAGTSLICIQGDWSNVVDAKIKGRLAAALGVDSTSPYSPLYARATGAPKPWGVTALFAEFTGPHPPLEIDWSLERDSRPAPASRDTVPESIAAEEPTEAIVGSAEPAASQTEQVLTENRQQRGFPTFWEFAVALNRSDPAALALAGGSSPVDMPMDGAELRKLLGMMWFRAVLPRLSRDWSDRILRVLADSVTLPNHAVTLGRRTMHLRDLDYAQLQEIASRTFVPEEVRPDLDLLLTVGRFWGAESVKGLRFVETAARHEPTTVESLLQRFRG